jgi:hypothetical protein
LKISSIYQKLHNAKCDDLYEPTQEQFDLVYELVHEYFGDDYWEKLVEISNESIDIDKVALYLSMAGWETIEAAKITAKTVEKWLLGEDLTRIKIALSNEIEWLPFKEYSEMKSALNNVKEKFPELTERCNQLIYLRGKK